jgi:hypothetical protein
MGTAAQTQQLHRGGGAVAAAQLPAAVHLQVEVFRQNACAAAHGGLAQAADAAGLQTGAADLKEIQQADVLQQGRQAIAVGRLGNCRSGDVHRGSLGHCWQLPANSRA